MDMPDWKSPINGFDTSHANSPVFKYRLNGFLSEVRKHFHIEIKQVTNRDPAKAHRMHLCHMFLYNKFKAPAPIHDRGQRTISWRHMKRADLIWQGPVRFDELLRTKSKQRPRKELRKEGGKHVWRWLPGFDPDRKMSEENMQKILNDSGAAIGQSGKRGDVMIACGVRCGAPCGCPHGISKHVSGEAADLGRKHLHLLARVLQQSRGDSLDGFLARFGLHRPFLHSRNSPEEWHVESLKPGTVPPVKAAPAHHRALLDLMWETRRSELCC